MARQLSNANNKLLEEKAIKAIKKERISNGSELLHAEGLLFKVARITLNVILIVNIVLLTAQLIGYLILLTDEMYVNEGLALFINDLRTTAICLVLLVTGYIFLRLKKYTVSSALFVAEAIIFLPTQSLPSWAISGAQRPVLMYTIPVSIMGIAALYMLITKIADKIILNRKCEELLNKIAAAHPNTEGEITTEEQWTEYINAYMVPKTHAKPKKSVKQKEKKEKKEKK